jgi:curved DNA-binding protein CbpA
MQYYAFIAGLPDLSLEDAKIAYSVEDFKQQLNEILSDSDRKLIHDLFLKYDNNNLLALLRNKDAVFNPKGTFTQEEITEMVKEIREVEHPLNKKILPYFKIFVTDFDAGNEALHKLFWEDQLASLYYDYLGSSKNNFIRRWAELNLNINNVMIALSCRRKGIAHLPYIVGNNETAENLRSSNARDFGLTDIFDRFEPLRRIDEEADLIEKEHKIDRLRWTWIDEENFFNYFTIERVIGYLFKLQMRGRWADLSEESGKIIFKEIIENLKKLDPQPPKGGFREA